MEYRLGLYEKALPDDLPIEDKLAAAKAAGFNHLEISIDESDWRQARLDWSQEEIALLQKAIAETDMPIATMCLSGHRKWPLGSHDAKTRAYGDKMFRRAVDLSVAIGVRVIQLAGYDVYYEDGDEDTRSWFAEGLARGVAYASERGVACGFETMETPFMDTVSKAMSYVRDINSPYLGVYPDLGNLTNACELYELAVDDEIAAGAGHTFAMHLKETVPGVYRDMRFGDGRNDFTAGIKAALNQGVRLFTAEMWHDGREAWEDGLEEASQFLRAKFGEAISAIEASKQ